MGADAQIVAAGHGHADPIVPDRIGHPQGHSALAVAVPPVSGVYQLQLRLPRIDVPLERHRSLIVALQGDPRIVPLLLEACRGGRAVDPIVRPRRQGLAVHGHHKEIRHILLRAVVGRVGIGEGHIPGAHGLAQNVVVHRGFHAADGEDTGVAARVRGGLNSLRALSVADGVHGILRQPVGILDLRLGGLAVAVNGVLRRLDGHAAAVPAAFVASGADGVAAGRVPPGMLVRAEVEGVVSLPDDLVVRILRVRGEDRGVVGLLLRRVGGDFDRAAGIGPVLCADADAGVRMQTVRADGDGFAAVQIEVFGLAAAAPFIHAACAVQRALPPVIHDLHAAGNGHRVVDAGQFHAAAPDGVVAGDAAAAHGEAAAIVHKHAATAAPVGAVARGVVAGDAAAAHGKAAVVHIHAAAVGVGGVAGDDRAAAHVERALVETHAAAVFGGAIAGDLAAGHGERAVLDIHTTAVFGGIGVSSRAAADGAASHGEGRAAVRIHAAAVFGGSLVAGDGAVVHGERAGKRIHAAAVVGRGVAGDAAAVHGDLGCTVHVHAAAITVGGRIFGDHRIAGHDELVQGIDGVAAVHKHTAAAQAAGGLVPGDNGAAGHFESAAADVDAAATAVGGFVVGDDAAEHGERAVRIAHTHAAAVVDAAAVAHLVAADLTAVHGEDGRFRQARVRRAFDSHAAAVDSGCVGDLTVGLGVIAAPAVGQGEAAGDADHFALSLHREAVPVQAEIERVAFLHSQGGIPLRIARQIDIGGVVGIVHDVAHAVPCRPVCVSVGAAGMSADLAADGVPVGLTVVEVDVVALLQGAVGAARIAEDIAVGIAVFRAVGDGDVAAGGDRIGGGHADAGFFAQTVRADLDGLAAHQIDVFIFAGRIAVAGDGRIAGDGEPGVPIYRRIHAAAVFGGVAGDLAALHDEFAHAGQIHTAAAVVGVRAVPGDAAAVHGKRAEQVVHTAAAITVCGSVVGDAAAVHVEFGVAVFRSKRHTAARGGAVSGDAAAVHIERAAVVEGYAMTCVL